MGVVEIILAILGSAGGLIKLIMSSPAIISAILSVVSIAVSLLKMFWNEIKKALGAMWSFFKEKFEFVMNWLKSILGKKSLLEA